MIVAQRCLRELLARLEALGIAAFDADPLCRARTRAMALNWHFLCSSGCSPILVNRPVDDLPAPDPAGDVDRVAGLMQRRSLLARLVRAMFVVMPRVLGEDPPEVSFAVDQQVVKALMPQRPRITFRE